MIIQNEVNVDGANVCYFLYITESEHSEKRHSQVSSLVKIHESITIEKIEQSLGETVQFLGNKGSKIVLEEFEEVPCFFPGYKKFYIGQYV